MRLRNLSKPPEFYRRLWTSGGLSFCFQDLHNEPYLLLQFPVCHRVAVAIILMLISYASIGHWRCYRKIRISDSGDVRMIRDDDGQILQSHTT